MYTNKHIFNIDIRYYDAYKQYEYFRKRWENSYFWKRREVTNWTMINKEFTSRIYDLGERREYIYTS